MASACESVELLCPVGDHVDALPEDRVLLAQWLLSHAPWALSEECGHRPPQVGSMDSKKQTHWVHQQTPSNSTAYGRRPPTQSHHSLMLFFFHFLFVFDLGNSCFAQPTMKALFISVTILLCLVVLICLSGAFPTGDVSVLIVVVPTSGSHMGLVLLLALSLKSGLIWPWPGDSVFWSIVPIRQGCGLVGLISTPGTCKSQPMNA